VPNTYKAANAMQMTIKYILQHVGRNTSRRRASSIVNLTKQNCYTANNSARLFEYTTHKALESTLLINVSLD